MSVINCICMLGNFNKSVYNKIPIFFIVSAPVPPEVSRLTLEELEELAECEEMMEDFVLQLPQLIAITEQCDKLAEHNMKLASM